MSKCSNPNCYAPDIGCYLGETELSKCKHWIAAEEIREPSPAQDKTNEVHLPWPGGALGLTDVEFITGSYKPIVVGIVGAENAGKTSLLASWYLLVCRGEVNSINKRFSGSFTLEGWESVSTDMRWEPGQPPCFPPHTSSSFRRTPGLLHMAFQDQVTGVIQHYLFADAPGEWFSKWALNSNAPEAEGARWLANHADVFLLVADRDALSGEKKGRARSEQNRLTQRLGGNIKDRSVALVWTKSDKDIDESMESSVKESTLSIMPNVREFKIQVIHDSNNKDPESNLLNLLSWTLEQQALKGKLHPLEYMGEDPFFRFSQRVLK